MSEPRISDDALRAALAGLPPCTETLSDLDRALLDLRDARARIAALEAERDGYRAGSKDNELHFGLLKADFDALRAEHAALVRALAECAPLLRRSMSPAGCLSQEETAQKNAHIALALPLAAMVRRGEQVERG